MTDYTIITTEGELRVQAERFRRDADGDLYCYDDGDEAVAHVESSRFVGILESDSGRTTI